jgi:glycosyltransferase involved in cell wall biosynthesis
VGSPVGANKEIIEDGTSGLFADTPEEWHAALDRLIRDDAFRKTLAENGRARAIAHYSLSHTASQFLRILHETRDRAMLRG